MINLLYVGLAFVVSFVGYLILTLRHRKPTSVEHGIEEFARELRALAPGGPARRSRWHRKGGRSG